MEPQHTNDLLKHLEKQNDVLKEARKMMLEELQKLEVEEHMMMHKLKDLLITHRLNDKVSKEQETISRRQPPPLIHTYQRRRKKKSDSRS